MNRILVLEERIPDLLARVSEIEIRLKIFRWKAFLTEFSTSFVARSLILLERIAIKLLLI